MKRSHFIYAAYMVFFIALLFAIFVTPYLAFNSDMSLSYSVFAATCHQKLSRSLCLFNEGGNYWIADCIRQSGTYVDSPSDRTAIKVQDGSATGYKMPVCSRDIGLYGAMAIAGLAYPFVRRLDDAEVYPAIYLIIALIPLGLDGGVQLVSELGLLPFVYESTNSIRLITGAIAGIAASFYAIPILVNLFNPDKPAKK